MPSGLFGSQSRVRSTPGRTSNSSIPRASCGRGGALGWSGRRNRSEQEVARTFFLPEPYDGRPDDALRLAIRGTEVCLRGSRMWLSGACPSAVKRGVFLGWLAAARERTILLGKEDASHPIHRLLATAPIPGYRDRPRQHLRGV